MPRQRQRPAAEQDWPARVRRLEAEIAGLRRAMLTRGLIEQAKGLLAERLGCDPETAFTHLSRASQEKNLPLVDLAADLVGATVPDLPEAEDPEAAILATAAGGNPSAHVRLHIAGGLADGDDCSIPVELQRLLRRSVAAMDAAADLDGVAEALVTVAFAGQPGAAVAIFAVEPDGAIRLLASNGWPAQVASEWQRTPPSVTTTISTVLRTGQPLAIDGESPHPYFLIGPGVRRAVFPLLNGTDAVGALSLISPDPKPFTAPERAFLDRLAIAAGRAIRERWPAEVTAHPLSAAADPRLTTVLDTVYAQGHLLSPIMSEDGDIVDFRIDATTAETRRSDGDTVGRRLLDVYPQLETHGVFAAYTRLYGRDTVFERPAAVEETVIDGRLRRVIMHRRAALAGDSVIATWQRIDEAVSLDERVDRLEALSRMGWAEWDLRAGDATWSPGLNELLGREPTRAAPRLEKFADLFPGEDRRAARRLLRKISAGQPSVAELRITTATQVIPVRVFGEAETDPDGSARLIRLVIQDITDQVAAEERFLRSERMLAARQLRLAQEQGVTQALTELLYPKDDLDVRVPGFQLAGRHQAAAGTPALRGDFCDAVPTPDGGALAALGDMFGVGLVAAASVIRLRYPAVALGSAGSTPDTVLTQLNAHLMADAGAPMASLIVARLEPDATLTWSAAGHLPPMILRDGETTVLDDTPGPALGLARAPRYVTSRVTLRPGDVFICYTNGLVDHSRDAPLADLAERITQAFMAGGLPALLGLVPPATNDEACLLAVQAL